MFSDRFCLLLEVIILLFANDAWAVRMLEKSIF